MNPTKPASPAVVIGLLGGIASGKSWVAGALAEHGFRTIDADAEAREVCADPKILAAIGARFGSELVEAGLNRPALANLVFQDPVARKDLEAITHPMVRARILALLAEAREAGEAVVLDVPLLLEGGLIEECDATIFLQVDEKTRQNRAAARGWAPEELARRESSQAPLTEKQARCQFMIHNEGDIDDIQAQISTVISELRNL